MNKQRRKDIGKATSLLSEAKGLMEEASAKAAEARDILETARDEEQDYYDNMPENMQGGDKGSVAEQAVSDLDTATEAAGSGVDYMDEVVSAIGDAIEKMEGDALSSLDEAESYADDSANG